MKTITRDTRIPQHSPPHPGEVLSGLWLEPLGLSVTEAAKALGVSRKTISKIVNGSGAVTPEMAMRLELAFGASAQSWLSHQAAYDLWQVERRRKSLAREVHPVEIHASA
jgi:addiction module HigA family antidote